jgi:hypothetical protein
MCSGAWQNATNPGNDEGTGNVRKIAGQIVGNAFDQIVVRGIAEIFERQHHH